MNDFESRARAAARAVHAAVETPAGELTTAASPHRGPTRALLIAAAVVIVAAVIGTTLVTRDEGAGPASDVTTFCAQVEQLVSTPVDVVNGERQSRGPSMEFLRDAPDEIRPTALAILAASKSSRSPATATSQRFLTWWQLRCYPNAATPSGDPRDARFAPTPTPGDLQVCSVTNGSGSAAILPQSSGADGTITIYGDATRSDPYDGPMIGVVRTKDQVFYSDDHTEPVTVAGHPNAEIIDATGMWGAAIPDLGQTVTWKDDLGVVAVIGRGWRRDQADQLATLAAGVADTPHGLTLTNADGDGLRPLYSGPVADVYVREVTAPAHPSFTVSYLVADKNGLMTLSGGITDRGAVDAIRFFGPGLRHDHIGGTDVVTGVVDATNTQPGVVVRIAAWTEGEVTLTLRALDADADALLAAAEFGDVVDATRALDRPEWERLVNSQDVCLGSESSSASGSVSGSGSSDASTETSTTTYASPPNTAP